MAAQRVLLVPVGAFGDLAWRKFLENARSLEGKDHEVAILLVDRPWAKQHGIGLQEELRWRIGRRLIEIQAEKLHQAYAASPEKPSISLKKGCDLGSTQFPWDVNQFVEKHLDGTPHAREKEQQRLRGQLDDWVEWFKGESPVSRLPRYSDLDSVKDRIYQLKSEGWKVVVFVATPPDVYAPIIKDWAAIGSSKPALADLIVLEKPASGLKDPLEYAGTHSLREACQKANEKGVQVVTNDHYNAKLITRVLDRIRDYHLFDYLLDPARVQRVVVELLETAPLPLGRCKFLNGAGGAFGDMVPHLLQSVRALLALPTKALADVKFESFRWARYANAPLEFPSPTGLPYEYDPLYYEALHDDTETFVAFRGSLPVGGHDLPLYCRTGKGFRLPGKTLRVDTRYNDSGSALSLIFDFESASISLRDDPNDFVLATGRLSLKECPRTGEPVVAFGMGEYEGIFEALVRSVRESTRLNNRFFPAVDDAADLADTVFKKLVEERQSRTIETYDTRSRPDILDWCAAEAKW